MSSIQGGAFRTLFETLKEIVFDTNLVFDEQGIRLICMDGARCALIYLILRAESMEEYHCPQKVRIGLNMAAMYKLVRICGSHDTITMYNLASSINELGIRICNSEKNSVTDFRLKLLDVDGQEITLPDAQFDTVMTLPSVFFQRIARDMSNLADAMTIKTQGKQLILSCEGDFASQHTAIGESTGDGLSATATCEDVIEATYSLKYLTLFCRASSLCSIVELYIKKDYPLCLSFNVAGLGELRFVLAPKVGEHS